MPQASRAAKNLVYKKMGRPELSSAMREVHRNVPRSVKKTGKIGKAKEKMLRAIAFSKAGY